MVKVTLASGREHLAGKLAHPIAGVMRNDGTDDWPEDIFTHRRLEEGDLVTDVQAKKAARDQPQPEQQPAKGGATPRGRGPAGSPGTPERR